MAKFAEESYDEDSYEEENSSDEEVCSNFTDRFVSKHNLIELNLLTAAGSLQKRSN